MTSYGSDAPPARRSVRDLQERTRQGERWTMATATDATIAALLEQYGIAALLVDSSTLARSNGHHSPHGVTLDETVIATRAVRRGSERSLIAAELPFGSFEASPEQALHSACRLLKEAGAQAIALTGTAAYLAQVRALDQAGIPAIGTLDAPLDADGSRLACSALQRHGASAIVMRHASHSALAGIPSTLGIPIIGQDCAASTNADLVTWQQLAGIDEGTPGQRRAAQASRDCACTSHNPDEARTGAAGKLARIGKMAAQGRAAGQ